MVSLLYKTEDVDLTAGLSIYVHIPFCTHKCYFCDFFSVQGWSQNQRDQIIQNIYVQLKQVLEFWGLKTIQTFYLGGGTPSLLSPKQLANFLEIAEQYQAQEITVEANPESLTPEWISTLFTFQGARLSLGVQSFLIEDLRSLGRIVSLQELEQNLAWLAPHHEFINLDLLAGLKNHTWQNLEKELTILTDFDPGHISFYMLTVEEGTPLIKRQHLIAPEEERTELWLAGRALLHSKGYMDYEISNFTQKHPSLHNMRYWDLEPYLGIGPGAVSNLPLKDGSAQRLYGTRKLHLWGGESNNTLERDLYTGEIICKKEFLFEHFMMGLRTRKGVNLNTLQRRFSKLATDLIKKIREETQIPLVIQNGKLQLDNDERIKLNRHLLNIMNIQETDTEQVNE